MQDNCGSPFVQGDLVILSIGEHGIALSKSDGAVKWKSAAKPAGYSTPYPMPGKPGEIILCSDKAYFGVDAASGKMLWQYQWKTQYGVNAADPIVFDGQVFISSGYKKGATLIKLGGSAPEKVWENKVMRSQFNARFIDQFGKLRGGPPYVMRWVFSPRGVIMAISAERSSA